MHPIRWLVPVDLSRAETEAQRGPAVAVFDRHRIAAENDRDSVEWITVPWRGFSGREDLPPDESGSAVVQDVVYHSVRIRSRRQSPSLPTHVP